MFRPNRISKKTLCFLQAALALFSVPNLIRCLETQQNNSQLQVTTNKPSLGRDVTNLTLTSSFRSVKLSWIYEHNDANTPTAFDLRYCEITSWNVEIKCRHKDLSVVGKDKQTVLENSSTTVIKPPINHAVRQLDGARFEAQIYDLRALTNYTFQVRVARFNQDSRQTNLDNEPNWNKNNFHNPTPLRTNRGQQLMGRRLDIGTSSGSEKLGQQEQVNQVETKPFVAEATKCLADVTDVIINTGPYFGGRISAEDSLNPRCSLIGNKTSEQSSYLLRIDHAACNSKVMDGNRIETMVLVHENKDILTHNTARFLVLCNFQQKSYTVRASVSLPKVNGIMGQGQATRPAVITPLAGKPIAPDSNSTDIEGTRSVMLGSMPGIYRARSSTTNPPVSELINSSSQLKTIEKYLAPNETSNEHVDELETNTIEKFSADGKLRVNIQAQRQSKELFATQRNQHQLRQRQSQRNLNLSGGEDSRARALTLSSTPTLPSSDSTSHFLPQPVQVQSKVLFVEQSPPSSLSSSSSRSARRQQFEGALQEAITSTPNLVTSSSRIDTSTTPIIEPVERDARKQSNGEESDADLQVVPIIITNNHRVSGEYLPVSKASAGNDQSFSIKYSTVKVNEYPLDEDPIVATDESSRTVRARSGRMRSLDSTQPASIKPPSTVNRMGELVEPSNNSNGDLFAETSTSNEVKLQAPLTNSSTLAQNITSYLLKWSLKTLTNLAKKSLESLIKPAAGDNDTAGLFIESDHYQQLPTSSDNEAHKFAPQTTPESPRSSSPFGANSSEGESFDTQSSKEHDGFITSTTTTSEPPASATIKLSTPTTPEPKVSAPSQLRHVGRLGNYSKSLDLSRSGETTIAKALVSEKNRQQVNSSGSLKAAAATTKANSQPDQQAVNSRLTGEGVRWAFYACSLLIGLLVGVLFLIWLLSMSPAATSREENSISTPASQYQQHPMMSDGESPIGGQTRYNSNPDRTSYQKYDYNSTFSSESHRNNNIDRSGLLASQETISGARHLSPSTASTQSTRSTSAGSSSSTNIIVDESDCKNQEFLFTEHVLINPGSAFGESFA